MRRWPRRTAARAGSRRCSQKADDEGGAKSSVASYRGGVSVVEWLLAVAALLFLGTTVAVVWSLVVLARRMTRRARRAVGAARGGVLAVPGVLPPTAALRRDLERAVLLARQPYQLPRRDKRPVAD